PDRVRGFADFAALLGGTVHRWHSTVLAGIGRARPRAFVVPKSEGPQKEESLILGWRPMSPVALVGWRCAVDGDLHVARLEGVLAGVVGVRYEDPIGFGGGAAALGW